MASNFRISTRRDNSVLHLSLTGDFDASSALELLNRIRRSAKGIDKVVIYTDGLRDVHLFGQYTFQKNMCLLNDTRLELQFEGKTSDQITLEGCSSV